MLTHAILILALTSVTLCDEARKHKQAGSDPFAVLDQHISHSLAYHYLWPWSQLIRAAAALDAEDALEDPKISSDANKFEIAMSVKRFKPEELRIKVKNRYIIVEGKHKDTSVEKNFFANHFVQRFVLPAGSKSEEVTAVLQENGVLNISAPKHELPPPPPERDVPIEVRVPTTTAASEPTTKEPEPSTKEPEPSTGKSPSTTPEYFELAEATTYAGKLRKKELKTTTKAIKDNEVTKNEGNGLDLDYVYPEGQK